MINYEDFNALTNYNLDLAFGSIQNSKLFRQRVCNLINYLRNERKDEFVSVNEVVAHFASCFKSSYRYIIDRLIDANLLAWDIRKEETITVTQGYEWDYESCEFQTVKQKVQVRRKYVKYVGR